MEYMESKYAFEGTKAQYVKHLGRWGFSKNQKIPPSHGAFIGRRVEKRKLVSDKHESEVFIDGVQYPPRKVKKMAYGKGYIGLRSPGGASFAPSPDTPEGVVVCTPATPGMRLSWDASLPWLRFLRLLQPGQGQPSLGARLQVSSPQTTDALSHAVNPGLLGRLGSLIPWTRLSQSPNVNSISRTATGLRILMPEESEGQIHDLATRFAESNHSKLDTLSREMYLLSNNLGSIEANEKIHNGMKAHDRRVLELFQMSGWNSVTRLQVLLSSPEPTAGAIAEKLFASAVRMFEMDIMKMMLEAGMSPDGCLDAVDEGPLTPLQFLALLSERNDVVEFIELLLSHGADLNKSYNDYSALQYATECGSLEVIELLLSRGALICAVELGSVDITRRLILMGAHLNDPYSRRPGSVLGAAIEKGDLALIHMVWSMGGTLITPRLGCIQDLETATFLQEIGIFQEVLDIAGAPVLASALSTNSDALVQMLLHHAFGVNSLDTDADNPNHRRSPLQAAITSNRFSLAHAILDRGATVTDVELAEAVAFEGHPDGVLLNRLLTGFQGAAPTAIATPLTLANPNTLQHLLSSGVQPTGTPAQFGRNKRRKQSGFDLEPPESVLEIPAVDGNLADLETLLRAYPWPARLLGRALTIAILFGHTDLVDHLLIWPLDINQDITLNHPETENNDGIAVPGYKEVIAPLQIASRDQHLSVVKTLLKRHDIDVNYLGAGVRRRTALQHAVDNGNMELVNFILDHRDCDINAGPARDGGTTALQMAAIRGYLGIARRLIDLGADVDAAAATVNGRTALEGAAEHGRIDMLQMLLDEEASVTGAGQHQFNRAVEFAGRNGHHAAARLLISFEPRQQNGGQS